MKLNYPKNWFEQHIERDGEVEVGVGIASRVAPGFFGQFVNLWRRNKGWKAEKLALEAGADLSEILEIEHAPNCHPAMQFVTRLAELAGVPARRLVEFFGLAESPSSVLRENAGQFSTEAEPAATLSEEERSILEDYLATLKARTNEA